MKNKIWPDYETESAAFLKAHGITRKPISADEYLRQRDPIVIETIKAKPKPNAPTPPQQPVREYTPRFTVLLFIGMFTIAIILWILTH